MLSASFLWVCSSDDICAIFNCLLSVERALLASEALKENLCFRGYSQIRCKNGQQCIIGVRFQPDSSSQFVFAYSAEAVAYARARTACCRLAIAGLLKACMVAQTHFDMVVFGIVVRGAVSVEEKHPGRAICQVRSNIQPFTRNQIVPTTTSTTSSRLRNSAKFWRKIPGTILHNGYNDGDRNPAQATKRTSQKCQITTRK